MSRWMKPGCRTIGCIVLVAFEILQIRNSRATLMYVGNRNIYFTLNSRQTNSLVSFKKNIHTKITQIGSVVLYKSMDVLVFSMSGTE